MQAFIILGTGTDVGKTQLSELLIRALHSQGPGRALKPIETGVVELPQDAARLARAAQHELIFPYFIAPDPISPHLAAEKCGAALSAASASEWCLSQVGEQTQWLVVETAGGIYSPISLKENNLSLAQALRKKLPQLRTVLVAGSRLGALHDVLVSVAALSSQNEMPDLIVLSQTTPPSSEAESTNLRELRRLQTSPVLELPHQPTHAASNSTHIPEFQTQLSAWIISAWIKRGA